MSASIYEFDEFKLDLENRTLSRNNGEDILLTPQAYKLLVFFVQNENKILKRNELLNNLWGVNTDVYDATLTEHVSKLRKALGKRDIIETIPKVGYKFAVMVEKISNNFNEESKISADLSEGNKSITFFGTFIAVTIFASLFISTILVLNLTSYKTNNLDPLFIDKSGKIFTLSAGIAHVIIVVFSFFYYQKQSKYIKRFGPINEDFTEDGKLARILRHIGYEDRASWNRAREVAQLTFNAYYKNWRRLLIVWIIFYLVVASASFIDLTYTGFEGKLKESFDLFENLINNFNSLFIWLCFYTLYKPLNLIKEETRISNQFYGVIFVSLIVILFIVELIFLYTSYSSEFIFRLISGFLGGVVLAIYTGRLQSKFFGLHNLLLFSLFCYAIIQPLFIHFNDPRFVPFIVYSALIFKSLLLLIMFYLFQSGRLFYYFVRVRIDLEKDWENFNSILR